MGLSLQISQISLYAHGIISAVASQSFENQFMIMQGFCRKSLPPMQPRQTIWRLKHFDQLSPFEF
jgi:hypothetical protein